MKPPVGKKHARRLILLLLLMPMILEGQGLEFGLKGGFNIGTPYGRAEKGSKGSLGIGPAMGIWIRARLNMNWRVQAEFNYSKKGSTFNAKHKGDYSFRAADTLNPQITHFEGRLKGEFDNTYLDIPVVFIYLLNQRWSLLIGPQFSYLLKGKNKGNAEGKVGDPNSPFLEGDCGPFDESYALNKWDYGMMAGTFYNINRKVYVGLNLTLGLVSIFSKEHPYINRIYRNIYAQAFLGFKVSKD